MVVKKRKAPKKERGKLLAAALKGPDALQAFNKDESARYEQGRISFLEDLAAELGLHREKFRSDGEWLYELAFRLAYDQYASTGGRGRPTELTNEDFQLLTFWKERETTGASERAIALNLVEIVEPWAAQFAEKLKSNEKKRLADRLPIHQLKDSVADNLRKRYRRIGARVEKKLGRKI